MKNHLITIIALLGILLPSVAMEKNEHIITCAGNFNNEIQKPKLIELIENRAPLEEIERVIRLSKICVNMEYNYSTPLMEAVSKGSKQLVRMLHSYGALLEPKTRGRRLTPLKVAVESENIAMVKLLVKLGAQVDYADDFYEETALYCAVARAQVHCICNRKKLLPIIEFLVEKGANCDTQTFHKITPRDQAQWTNDTKVLEILQRKN